jgi:hypothetical protein
VTNYGKRKARWEKVTYWVCIGIGESTQSYPLLFLGRTRSRALKPRLSVKFCCRRTPLAVRNLPHPFRHGAIIKSGGFPPSLKSFAGDGGIVFGTDFPFAPADIVASFTAKLDAYDGLTADEHKAINHDNAWTMFSRLAVMDASKEAVKAGNAD